MTTPQIEQAVTMAAAQRKAAETVSRVNCGSSAERRRRNNNRRNQDRAFHRSPPRFELIGSLAFGFSGSADWPPPLPESTRIPLPPDRNFEEFAIERLSMAVLTYDRPTEMLLVTPRKRAWEECTALGRSPATVTHDATERLNVSERMFVERPNREW
jgi:hypothetical protein